MTYVTGYEPANRPEFHCANYVTRRLQKQAYYRATADIWQELSYNSNQAQKNDNNIMTTTPPENPHVTQEHSANLKLILAVDSETSAHDNFAEWACVLKQTYTISMAGWVSDTTQSPQTDMCETDMDRYEASVRTTMANYFPTEIRIQFPQAQSGSHRMK